MSTPENIIITTGGGFSTLYAEPSFQAENNVKAYFALVAGTSNAPYNNTTYVNMEAGYNAPVGFYNRSGRGYPDISLFAHNYEVVLGSILVDGTSASADNAFSD